MKPHQWLMIGGVLGAVGILVGAFGAHSLPRALESLAYDEAAIAYRTDLFEKGARYQMYTAFAVLAVGLGRAAGGGWPWSVAGSQLLLGGVLFSGLLYALTFAGGDWRWLGAVVPFGGGFMFLGWVWIAVAGSQLAKNRPPEDEVP